MASGAPDSHASRVANDRAAVPLTQQPGPKIFFGGLVFATFSLISTRRALVRRRTPIPQMPAQARAQFAQSIKQQQQQHEAVSASRAKVQGPTGAPAHTTSPPPNSAPGTGSGRPNPLQTQGQNTGGVHAGSAPGYNMAAAEAGEVGAQQAAEAMAPELQNSGAVMAVEALALATLNVLSWGMVAVGGALWYVDVRSMEDLRRMVRGGMGADGTGRSEQDVEEEMEEWIASVLSRKEQKEAAKEAASRGKVLITDEKGRVRMVDEEPRKKTGWLW